MPTTQDQLTHISNTLVGLATDLSVLKNDHQRVIDYLENNPKTDEKGLISTQKTQGEKIQDILTRLKVFNAKALVYGSVAGGVVGLILKKLGF